MVIESCIHINNIELKSNKETFGKKLSIKEVI